MKPRAPVIYERLSRSGIRQAMIVSTCDRVEIQGAHEEPLDAMQEIRDIFASVIGGPAAEPARSTLPNSRRGSGAPTCSLSSRRLIAR